LKLPGCFVNDELFAKVHSETVDEHIERAAQQVAMYRSIGAAGVDIGSVHDFKMFIRILQRASEIGDDWQQFKDNLYWPGENGFYLYDDKGLRIKLSKPKKTLSQIHFNFVHRAILDPEHVGFHIFKRVMSFLGAEKGKGFVYKFFNAVEKGIKYLLFNCQACGDCYLPEDFSLCTIGSCEKSMCNVPCGDATVEGYCGNNLDLVCIGEQVYRAAAAQTGGIELWRATINKPRIHSLNQTASILNYLFGGDHTAKLPIVSIGDSLHSSIPKVARIMKRLHNSGPDAYSKPNGPLNYIKAVIESQAAKSADYIAVNLDTIAGENQQLAVDMIIEYVRMIREWGKTVPICIDSESNKVVIAGLKEWYNTKQVVKPPLLSPIKLETMDELLVLKRQYDYKLAGLLENIEQLISQSGTNSIDQLCSSAKKIFDKTVEKYGFKPGDLFFELNVCPLAADQLQADGLPGRTFVAFETVKKIRQDLQMTGVHFLIRPSAVGKKLPRSIGVCRAFVEKAMEYGIDAAFVNVGHQYGLIPADPELLELVDAYAKMDGSAGSKEKAVMLMNKFCRQNQKAKIKSY
jgi:hypothetical protein